MNKRITLTVVGLIVVFAALVFSAREGAHAQASRAHGGTAAQHTIYPDGGSDGPP
jgi:hypothetical protein